MKMKNLFLTMMTLTLLSTTAMAKSISMTTWFCTNEFTQEPAGKLEADPTLEGWQNKKNGAVPMYYFSSVDSDEAWELSLDVASQVINNASQMVQGGNPFKVGELAASSKQNPGAEFDVKLVIRGSRLHCQQ